MESNGKSIPGQMDIYGGKMIETAYLCQTGSLKSPLHFGPMPYRVRFINYDSNSPNQITYCIYAYHHDIFYTSEFNSELSTHMQLRSDGTIRVGNTITKLLKIEWERETYSQIFS